MKITTGQSRIPWLAVAALALPAGAAMFVEMCSSQALTFSMRKFISDPALIVFLGSINIAFNFLVAPVAAWKSDRVWTPWGRRIPFFVVGWSLLALALVAVPLAPNIGILVLVIVVYQFGMDFGYTGPWQPLYFESVPGPQRGRAVAMKRAVHMAVRMLFLSVFIGHFDAPSCGMLCLKGAARSRLPLGLSGEQWIYFAAAGMVVLCIAGVLFGIRETPEPVTERETSASAGYRGGIREFFVTVFGDPKRRLLYLLVFCSVAAVTGLGQLEPLLFTEQFGYTKQQMGHMLAWVMVPEVIIILPLIGLFVDRIDRFRLFAIGLVICTIHPLAYWLFVKYLAVGHVPSPAQIIAFTVAGHAGRMLACLSFEPILFDNSPCGRMGAVNSGLLLVQGAITLPILNGIGFWVKGYSAVFGAAGKFDYMSGYLYVWIICMLACTACLYFAVQRKRLGWTDLGSGMGRSCRPVVPSGPSSPEMCDDTRNTQSERVTVP